MTLTRMLPALVACLCATAQAQTALDTKTAIVSAEVQDVCKFTSSPARFQLTLGTLDPSLAPARNATEAYTFNCTNGFAFQIGVAGQTAPLNATSSHARTLTHRTDPTQTVGYTLSAALPNGNIGKGFSPSNQLTLRLSADVLASSYQDLKGGSYEDTLTIELRP
jgi:hypothetical protein